ncbi:4-hydroxyphenylacetate 3-monooxygenase operon regulatory protein [Salmonella enterica subsp. arizonae]|uniref:4-hydroxyphenylacetate 3-monooxygenase operon regulatory protein n=1 Tax=Salmonella enterica subsp. arizonae TaxID=59203 RepID=A0A379SZW2_SALER|nr:4-hydroxyphenylacetate 3-monooxygenase operon regulatory protein [Salmonella enterica subsp. arizonae]
MCQRAIANIDISKEYDESMGSNDVHYQSFARMADFFGRDMQAHRHDQFFQMHFLDTGQIELQLDDHRYSVQAPLFVLTPPSVPHAFITESDSDGHVLTVREELVGHCWRCFIPVPERPSACRESVCLWRINPTSWRRSNTTGS